MSNPESSTSILSTLAESRVFEPHGTARLKGADWLLSSLDEYNALHARSIEDPDGFWGEIASELTFFSPWDSVLSGEMPDARWFAGSTTNVCFNCVDRQVESGHGDEVAIIWEGEPVDDTGEPEVKRLTYRDLQRETARFANVLESMGVKKGDVVTLYMGMVPEMAIACLACARIGAPHSVIFGGFSAQAIADRVTDASSKLVITCDGLHRRGKVIPLKKTVDEAMEILGGPDDVKTIVFRRCKNDAPMTEGRDHDWDALMADAKDERACEPMGAEDTLFLLYTSGSTGKPKGIQHTTAGYMVYTYLTAKNSFNLVLDKGQVYWCTADIGWITGHSYILYGILPNRVPTIMYEGAPNYPDEKRFWQIVERHRVTQFYTAPTAIRAFMKWGDEHPNSADLSSLQVLGTVGEPINPETWMWYRRTIGGEACPIVDTYWQTETGGHVITPLPGAIPTTPGSCTMPALGVDAAVVTMDGNECAPNEGGVLVIRKPWPGMLRGVFGDRQRYIDTYWSTVSIDGKPVYTAGDGAKRDDNGNFWIMGRIDDVINVSGHRIGTMEVESSLVAHPSVVEAAVVGVPHEIKGTSIAAFVTLAQGFDEGDQLRDVLKAHVAKEIGSFAKPDQVRIAEAMPKTRSGKIMRRLLRDIASGVEEITQDTTTLEDHTIVDKLKAAKG